MPPDNPFALVNLGELSKPANTLIQKVSDAVGGLLAPWQIKRVAKAEAEAALMKRTSDIEITDLHRRAVHRWVEEEAQRQQNMESITAKALPQLSAESDPNSLDNDWIVSFFDRSRIVSDNEMQDLWSRILAGEANCPGTYSKRTVNSLSDIDKNEAALFTKFCGFVWTIVGDLMPLVFDETDDIYNRCDINFDTLQHLDSIGLIQFGGVMSMIARVPKRCRTSYYGRDLVLEMPKESDNDLEIGFAVLTQVGRELAPICRAGPVDGFWELVKDRWKQHLPQSDLRDG